MDLVCVTRTRCEARIVSAAWLALASPDQPALAIWWALD